MIEEGRRCLRLASLAAAPLGCVVGFVLGDSAVLALLVGVLSLALWLAAVVGLRVWCRGRALHEHSGHWVLTLIATAFPQDRALDWLEEMHDQLLELKGKRQRREYLVNLVSNAPRHWSVSWWARSQHTKRLRYWGNEQRLIRLLGMMLAPDGDSTTAVDVLHATGLSRLQSRQPAHRVPALLMARRLLATRGEHLSEARKVAESLLASRERAYVITQNLRRNYLAAWMRDHQLPYSRQYAELAQLRDEVQQQAFRLRTAIIEAAKKGRQRHKRFRP